MNKKLGFVSKGYIKDKMEGRKREVYSKEFKKYGFEPCFFNWQNVKNGEVTFENYNNSEKWSGNLKNLDYIAISSLGKLKGVEKKFVDYVNELKGLYAHIINDPETMIKNLDKIYLVDMINNGIDAIPTQDIKNMDYSSLSQIGNLEKRVVKPRKFGERGEGVKLLSSFKSEEEFNLYKNSYNGEILMQPFLEGIFAHGERSFVYVGKEFSHGMFRPRAEWKSTQGTSATKLIEPTKDELKLIHSTFDNYSSEYRVTRFDILTEKRKPMINELEQINPNVWVGRKIDYIDDRFPLLLSKYLEKN